MAPKSINSLPVELHTSILKYLLSLSRIPSLLPSDLSLSPVELEWTQKDIRSPSLFPFNVASASKLWRDILALIPECWTRVAFDVAKDPRPLLDVFLWSKDLTDIEVVVFNSDDTEIVGEIRELSFVLTIAEALRPHIHRCKSIIFDVTYVTSLPPPMMFFIRGAPYLEKLSLDCRIENHNLLHNEMEIGRQQDFSTSFPALKELSFTGFWFMYLVLHASDPEWIGNVADTVRISHFTFSRQGQYSLPEFASLISGACVNSVHYYDLSLAYTYDSSEPKSDLPYTIPSDQHFHFVSKDFISHLATISNAATDAMSFEGCEIPQLEMFDAPGYLALKNIIDDDEGTSLRHVLQGWTGNELTIRSCPSFNDSLLSWLASSKIIRDGMYITDRFQIPAEYLTCLTIYDCDNLSSRVLREFVYICGEATLALGWGEMKLFVFGRHPVLSDKDKRWFEQNKNKITVYWEAIGDDGKREIFEN